MEEPAESEVKTKRNISRRKLKNFFGDQVPVDVSVYEIQSQGLRAMIQSSVPLCYFLYCMLEDYSSENLFFYLEVEAFENHTFKSAAEMKTTAQQIYDMFIADGSDLEINIDQKIRVPIQEAISRYDQQCFTEAKEDMFKLMEPIFLKFKTSDVFDQMKADLGLNCIVYSKSARNAAVKMLLKNLDKTLPQEGTNPIVQQRHDLIRCIMHEFCRKRLKIDFYDSVKPKTESEGPQKYKKTLLLIQSIRIKDEGSDDSNSSKK